MAKDDSSSIDHFFKKEQWPLDFIRSEKFSYFLNQIPESIFMSDENGKIVQCNQNACRFTGYSYQELMSMVIEDLVPPKYRKHHAKYRESFFQRPFSRLMGESRLRLEIYTKAKKAIVIDAVLFAIKTDQGFLAVNFIRDMTEADNEKQRLVTQGTHDALTSLPNRYLLQDMFQQLQAKAKRERQKLILILFDLDKFKPVNDNYGHAVGDVLLKQLAQRLDKGLRGEDFIARIGGDEFVFLAIAEEFSTKLPKKLLSQLARPFSIDSKAHQVGASIGIVVDSTHKSELTDLLVKADEALYQSKDKGGNCFHLVEL